MKLGLELKNSKSFFKEDTLKTVFGIGFSFLHTEGNCLKRLKEV